MGQDDTRYETGTDKLFHQRQYFEAGIVRAWTDHRQSTLWSLDATLHARTNRENFPTLRSLSAERIAAGKLFPHSSGNQCRPSRTKKWKTNIFPAKLETGAVGTVIAVR